MLMRFKESPEPHGLPDCFDDKIMHATVRMGKTTLVASDGRCEGKQDFEGFVLSLTVLNETEPNEALLH
jgi:PhnB protein